MMSSQKLDNGLQQSLLTNSGDALSPNFIKLEQKDLTSSYSSCRLSTESNPARTITAFNNKSFDPCTKQLEPQRNTKESPNTVVTSRYTLLTFLPICIFEQFRRLANVYFLVLGLIAIVGEYTSFYDTAVQPIGILLPMVVVVLISAAKDGYEDVKRHRADALVNLQLATRVESTGNRVEVRWRDIQPGDVLLLRDGEPVPADVIVLATGGIQGPVCYIDTAALDGETNLKPKTPAINNGISVSINLESHQIYGFDQSSISVMVDQPSEALHLFSGSISCTDKFIPCDITQETTNQIPSLPSQTLPLSTEHLLLRGCVLRASEWCIALVIYTGSDTKLALNSKKTLSKLSRIDSIVNRALLVAIFALVVMSVVSMGLGLRWRSKNSSAKYLCLQESDLSSVYQAGGGCANSAPQAILTVLTFATLFNNVVCISMYVSLELAYLAQSALINNDMLMYDEASNTPAECRSSGLCADVGQVKYVLSDKTGTLTKNLMVLRRVSLCGQKYGAEVESNGHDKSEPGNAVPPLTAISCSNPNADSLLRIFLACNTVILMPERVSGRKVDVTDAASLMRSLQAESADEAALVLAAAEHMGAILVQRSKTSVVIQKHSSQDINSRDLDLVITHRMEILAVNAFDSDRKCMSVLVREEETNKITLLCKGADTSMWPLCDLSDLYASPCAQHVDEFACEGLRTLVFAHREVSADEAEQWLQQYNSACTALSDRRTTLLRLCARSIEKNLTLVGAVGIEDELQEGVGESIDLLQEAGVCVWMITGDKPETALAISKQCHLVHENKNFIEKIIGMRGLPLRVRLEEIYNSLSQRSSLTGIITSEVSTGNPITLRLLHDAPDFEIGSHHVESARVHGVALLIDGPSLNSAWKDNASLRYLQAIIKLVSSVIACRVSPAQKASLVRLVNELPGKPTTLAIGDGANDMAMIQMARVGVGISAGREGRHAANCSDFAIPKFKHIIPLMMKHGRYNYIRCSNLVLYSFYKNLVLVSVLFYYCFFSGFSGTVFVESLIFSGFNFYLGWPIIILASLDRDVEYEDGIKYPEAFYRVGQNREILSQSTMIRWSTLAFVQGLLLFIICSQFFSGPANIFTGGAEITTALSFLQLPGIGLTNPQGQTGGIYAEGFLIFTVIVFAMQYKVVAMTHVRTWIHWFFLAISYLGFFSFVLVYGLVTQVEWYGVSIAAFSSPTFWLAATSVPILICCFDYLFFVAFSILCPTSQDELKFKLRSVTSTA